MMATKKRRYPYSVPQQAERVRRHIETINEIMANLIERGIVMDFKLVGESLTVSIQKRQSF